MTKKKKEEEEVVKEEKKEDDMSAFTEFVKNVSEDLKEIKKGFSELKNRVDEIQPASKEPAQAEKKDDGVSQKLGERAIIEVVRTILGDGFEISAEPLPNGMHFALKIVPPKSLKESETDVRVKNIPYLEAESGTKQYAIKVREFCTEWAARNGRVYEWPTMSL